MEKGSIQNLIMSGKTGWHKPVVGEGATRIYWTDRDPYTVVEVSKSGKTVWVTADTYERTDDRGMSESQQYKYTSNMESTDRLQVRWTGKRWLSQGGSNFVIGRREKYHDFSF